MSQILPNEDRLFALQTFIQGSPRNQSGGGEVSRGGKATNGSVIPPTTTGGSWSLTLPREVREIVQDTLLVLPRVRDLGHHTPSPVCHWLRDSGGGALLSGSQKKGS